MSINVTKTYAQVAAAALDRCFTELGGVDALVEWARKNPDKFYLFLWPRLLPKEIKATVDYGPSPVVQAVEVPDVRTALNALEQMRYASDPHSGCGGDGDPAPLDSSIPAHAIRVQEVDGGGTRSDEASRLPDATTTREDDVVCVNPAISLPHDVSLAGSNVCDALSGPGE